MEWVPSKFLLFVVISVLLLWIILIGHSNNYVNDFKTKIFSVKERKLKIQETRENTMLRLNWKCQYECITNAQMDSNPPSLHWQHLTATSVQQQQALLLPRFWSLKSVPTKRNQGSLKEADFKSGAKKVPNEAGGTSYCVRNQGIKNKCVHVKKYTGISPKNTQWLKLRICTSKRIMILVGWSILKSNQNT